MSESIEDLVDSIRRHYDDGCFACGRDNPIGLHLDEFGLAEGRVTAAFKPRPHYRGAGTTLHGGVAATALDEILVWAGLLVESVLSVTGTLELRYRRPVEVDDHIVASAWVVERRGRRLRLAGELATGDEVAVGASGLYLVTTTVEDLLSESH